MKSALYFFLSELIETLWNVNAYRGEMYGVKNYELIETLWNVN